MCEFKKGDKVIFEYKEKHEIGTIITNIGKYWRIDNKYGGIYRESNELIIYSKINELIHV